jgi:hypothetical protein
MTVLLELKKRQLDSFEGRVEKKSGGGGGGDSTVDVVTVNETLLDSELTAEYSRNFLSIFLSCLSS